MKPIDIILLTINVLLSAFANIVLKFATLQKTRFRKLFFTLLGFGIYFLMSFVTVYLYRSYSLVLVQGLLTLTYIATPIMAYIFYKEHLPRRIWVSIFLIIIGIVFVVVGSSQID